MCPGSNVNQEVVQMAAASAVEVLRSQLVKDAVAEAVFILAKRQKYTLTRLPDIGQRILNESVPDSPWFEANLASTSFCLTFGIDGCKTCDSTNIIIVTLRSVLIVCCNCIVF